MYSAKGNAEFVTYMEDIHEPLPIRPGDNQKIDSEYVRKGTCSIFIFTEPLSGDTSSVIGTIGESVVLMVAYLL